MSMHRDPLNDLQSSLLFSLFGRNNTAKKITLARGNVLRVEYVVRFLGLLDTSYRYDHFGIYARNREVIHFSDGKIRRDSIKKFLEDSSSKYSDRFDVMKFADKYANRYTLEESYQRALSKIGKSNYDVVDNNCEHFALWCRIGEAYSGQATGTRSDHYLSGIMPMPQTQDVNLPRLIGQFFNEFDMKCDYVCRAEDLEIPQT